jgi:hypothetical protein
LSGCNLKDKILILLDMIKEGKKKLKLSLKFNEEGNPYFTEDITQDKQKFKTLADQKIILSKMM